MSKLKPVTPGELYNPSFFLLTGEEDFPYSSFNSEVLILFIISTLQSFSIFQHAAGGTP